MFTGKTVLVTGGAGGIGSGISTMFLELGAKVIINDISQKALENFKNSLSANQIENAEMYTADLRSSSEVNQMMESVIQRYGTIDILINAAGFGIVAPSIVDISDEEWDLVVNVNLRGAFYTSRAIIPLMKKNRSGRIINISSLAGRTKSVLAGVHYTSAKAGMLGLTRHLAAELSSYNITVNAVCPGVTDTPLVRGQKDDNTLQELASTIPIPRLGTVEDVVNAVKFLADEKNSYITGTSLDVNGGLFMN